MVGRVNKEDCQPLINRFQSKLAGWRTRLINKAGRLCLVNSDLYALPNHIMVCVIPPSGINEDMEKIKISFLWGRDKDKKKLHYFSWKTSCAPLHSCG